MHIVKLTDGTNTITLTTSPYTLNHYEMATTSISVNEVAGRDIRERVKGATYGPITDRLKILIQGSNPADAQAKFSAIETMLQFSLRRANIPTGQDVELQVQMSSDAALWKADVLFGTIQPNEDLFVGVPQSIIEATILITRDVFRGPVVQLGLTNANESGSAIEIDNRYDATHDNTARITSTIAGSLPAPVKIRLKNTYGSSVTFKNVFFGINTHSDPENMDHILEGEDSLFGSTVASATSSGGEHQTNTVTQASTVGAKFAWLLDSTFLSRTKGESFVMLARFKGTPPNDVLIAPQVGTYDSPLFLPTWTGNEILVSDFEEIVNLGTVNLPGPSYVPGSNYSYGVAIAARGLASGTKTLTLDYVMLVPSDSWSQMRQSSSLLTTNNEHVCLDDIDGEYTYQKVSPTYQKLQVFSKTGPTLKIWPNRTNKIIVLWESNSEANVNWTADIEAWYEPQRLTI